MKPVRMKMVHDSERDRLEAYVRQERRRFERLLREFVEVPSISMDPARHRDIQDMADLAVDTLGEMGASAKKVRTEGNPVVVGKFRASSRYPTVTVYNHLDVQPAGEPEWRHDPFRFEIQDGRYFGRGATDDKGPALTALLAARYAVDHRIPINIQFVWELEEEIGSPHFGSFLKKMREEIQTDSVLVSDTIWVDSGRPSIPYGLRGMLTARLVLETARKEAHSGLTGGVARNPVSELCQVIAQCHDARSGAATIPGFYREVLPPRIHEIRDFDTSGFSVSHFKKSHGLVRMRTGQRSRVMRRIWIEPTFEVHGISGGYQGPGVKTSIAPRAEAKLSMRLVPRQDPRRILALFRRHVRRINPDVRIFPEGALKPYLGSSDSPYAQAARRAFRFGFGRDPVFVREGGSIGAVVLMDQVLRAPIVFMGLSLPEHGYHGPNEFFDWRQASGGMKSFVKYFSEIARIR